MQKVEEKLEYWVDKYENDTDAKDKELDALKVLKANNLEILQGLAKEVRHQQYLCSAMQNCILAFSSPHSDKEPGPRKIKISTIEV